MFLKDQNPTSVLEWTWESGFPLLPPNLKSTKAYTRRVPHLLEYGKSVSIIKAPTPKMLMGG